MREVAFFGPDAGTTVVLHADNDAAERLAERTGVRIAVPQGIDWESDMTPWPAPAVFPKGKPFAGRGETYLAELMHLLGDGRLMIAGYSLGGLFAMYAALATGRFDGVAAVSGSFWYPGFTDWMRSAPGRVPFAYVSVGDLEGRGRNPQYSQMEVRSREAADILRERGAEVRFELNPGNHFFEPEERLARGLRALAEAARGRE